MNRKVRLSPDSIYWSITFNSKVTIKHVKFVLLLIKERMTSQLVKTLLEWGTNVYMPCTMYEMNTQSIAVLKLWTQITLYINACKIFAYIRYN